MSNPFTNWTPAQVAAHNAKTLSDKERLALRKRTVTAIGKLRPEEAINDALPPPHDGLDASIAQRAPRKAGQADAVDSHGEAAENSQNAEFTNRHKVKLGFLGDGISKSKRPINERRAKSGYNPQIVLAYFNEMGLPEPVLEYQFHPERRWRFDFSWEKRDVFGWDEAQEVEVRTTIHTKLALEVQGGIWSQGRHTRGAALLKEWEKLNQAAVLGWRILYCQPDDLCTEQTIALIKRALGI